MQRHAALLLAAAVGAAGFLAGPAAPRHHLTRRRWKTLGEVDDQARAWDARLSAGIPDGYVLALPGAVDVNEVCGLLVECFPNEVSLSPSLSRMEMAAVSLPVGLWNSYSRAVAMAEVALALRGRCGRRLAAPTLCRDDGAMLLGLLRYPEGGGGGGGVRDLTGAACVAVVELRLQPSDGALPTDLPLPIQLPRRPSAASRAPYLCNLAVLPELRRRGHAQRLVDACELIGALFAARVAFVPAFVPSRHLTPPSPRFPQQRRSSGTRRSSSCTWTWTTAPPGPCTGSAATSLCPPTTSRPGSAPCSACRTSGTTASRWSTRRGTWTWRRGSDGRRSALFVRVVVRTGGLV